MRGAEHFTRVGGSSRGKHGAGVGNRRLGFTLVELLVTISIIALLITILLPSLKTAREQARTVVCLSSMKGVAIASNTYATADRNEQAIPVHPLTGGPDTGADVGSYDWGGKSGIGEPRAGSDIMTSRWGTANGRGPATRPLNTVIAKTTFTDFRDDPGVNQANWFSDTRLDLGHYRCPSDRGYTGHHFQSWRHSRLSSYDFYGTSYAANSIWCAVHQNQCVIKSWGPFLRPMTRIPNPANTVYYIENCGRFAWRSNLKKTQNDCWTATDGPHFSQTSELQPVKGWHGKLWHFVTGFVDGHVAMVKIDGFLWPPPIIPVDIHGDQILARCHVIRGHGWQFDVLPAPPVLMPVRCGFQAWPADSLK
ncbi:MAG: prepilin-type N-terminal cleavage/methylation domain-containing protein [Phycisphaerales bacterium]|nr:prepilin-type N-terminal cleavage/methylation domain-containing protein [Phycisphaerales bacterium]